jgi:hypothetical protein
MSRMTTVPEFTTNNCWLFPTTLVPFPAIVTLVLMIGRLDVMLIVVTDALTVIVCGPAPAALALVIAWLNEPAPELFPLVTANDAARASGARLLKHSSNAMKRNEAANPHSLGP